MSTTSVPVDSSAADAKRFIDAKELHHLAEDLAFKVADDDFQPTFLIALWRGGCAIGAVVQEVLQYLHKNNIDHVAVRTESRDANGVPLPEIRIHAIGHAVNTLQKHDRLLIVDDVFDSGRSSQALLGKLHAELGPRMPETRVAVVFDKPLRHKTPAKPDYFVEQTDAWLVFPHEIEELSDTEIQAQRPRVWAYMQNHV